MQYMNTNEIIFDFNIHFGVAPKKVRYWMKLVKFWSDHKITAVISHHIIVDSQWLDAVTHNVIANKVITKNGV